MKQKRFHPRAFLILLLLCSLLLSAVSPGLAAEDAPVLDARGAVMMDAASGSVLYELNADTPLYVAGLTVMMTALLAAEAVERGDCAWTDVVTASAASHIDITADASIQNIVPGEEMPLRDLVTCAIVGGASEACNIIAEYVAGSIPAFLRLMNDRAVELGCTRTNFVNTHGLPNDNHYSSARDMALIAAAFTDYPDLMDIANTVSAEIPATNLSGARKLTNANYIINTDYTRYYYSHACGIKCSHTEDAGYCLASSMKTNDNYVVCIVLGCRIEEADNGFFDIQSFVQAKRLFQWFNSCYSLRDVVSTIEPIVDVPILLGEGTDTVVCCALEGLKLFLPNDLDISAAYRRSIRIYSQEDGQPPLTAPVLQGQLLGELTVTDGDGNVYGPYPLIANTDVAVSRVEQLRQRLRDMLHSSAFAVVFWVALAVVALYIVFVIRYRVRRSRERKARRMEREAASRRE